MGGTGSPPDRRSAKQPRCRQELRAGTDQRSARPRLPPGGRQPLPPGPGPVHPGRPTNNIAALSLDHRFVVELNRVLGCNVLVGVRVADAIVFLDHVGQESPALTYVARTHARRPLYTSAAGKTLLANLPDGEMYRLLDLAGPERADDVRRFLTELGEIRATGLAFNRGTTMADAFVVATPLLGRAGAVIAAFSAAVEPPQADRLDQLGEELKRAVADIARRDHPGRTPHGE